MSELLYWLDDNRNRGAYYRVRSQLNEVESQYQRIEILDFYYYGKALVLSGEFQFSELDASRYHELLVHVPLLSHPKPKRVLIFGGGDGFAALEAIKHPSIEEVVVAELDPAVPEACRPFFKETNKAFADKRVNLVIGDAKDAVARAIKAGETFDAVLSDLTSIKRTLPLHSQEFLSQVKGLMSPEARYANHFDLEGPFSIDKRRFISPRTISSVFKQTGIIPFYMPAFIAEYAITIAGERPMPEAAEMAKRAKQRGLRFEFYDPLFHYPRLPEFFARQLKTVAPMEKEPEEPSMHAPIR